jgi:predicted transcriptional regulator
MTVAVRLEPELERQLDRLAELQGVTRSACIRAAIRDYLCRHGDAQEAQRQSGRVAAAAGGSHWSEQIPDWSDWTA